MIDRIRQKLVAFRSPRQPAFQTLQVEKPADIGIFVRHAEQEFPEEFHRTGHSLIEHSEVAVIVQRRGGNCADGPRRKRALLREQKEVAVDQAGGIAVSANERPRSVAFPSDMIPVLADQLIEREHLKVAVWLKTLLGDVIKRDKRRLGRVLRADGDTTALKIAHAPNRTALACHDHGNKVAVRVTHANGLGTLPERACDPFGL